MVKNIDYFYYYGSRLFFLKKMAKTYILRIIPIGFDQLMKSTLRIDEIDAKILSALIKDARTKIKDMAKNCGISSTAIVNRIKRLETDGVIEGTVLFWDMSVLGFLYPASFGINLDYSQTERIIKLIEKRSNVIILSKSVGKHDLTVFLVAKSLRDIDQLKHDISAQAWIRKIAINLWTTPHFNFGNLEIKPAGA